jgi:hypothetical protein
VAEESEEATPRILRVAAFEGAERPALWVAGAGLASLGLYRALAELGDLRAHMTAYLVIHAFLFAIYAGIVFLLARRVFTLPPWTARRAAPPFVVARRDSAAPPAIVVPEPPPAPRGPLDYPLPPPARDGRPRSRVTPILLVAFAIAFRATLLFVPPSLTDSTIPTIHPPLAEAFAAAARAELGGIGHKGIFILFDLAVAGALALLLRRLGRPMSFAALYLWNPLVVVEVAGSGHTDPLGILLLVLSALFIAGERRALGIASYAASLLARVLPLAFAPIFIRRFKAHHLLLGAGIVVLGVLPYAGSGRAMVSKLAAHAGSADHNSVVFPAVRAALDAVVPVETLEGAVKRLGARLGDPAWCEPLARWVHPDPLARGLLLFVLLAGMIVIGIDVPEIQRELLCAAGLLFVLSPAVHPWLVLWIVPFAAAEVSLPWLLFTGLVPLSYLSLRAPDGRVPLKVLAIEWGAPALLGIVLRVRKQVVARRIRALAARA